MKIMTSRATLDGLSNLSPMYCTPLNVSQGEEYRWKSNILNPSRISPGKHLGFVLLPLLYLSMISIAPK